MRRFTTGIPRNTGINIVGRYTHGGTKRRRGGRYGKGTGIKIDGANRMLIESGVSFCLLLYQFGASNPARTSRSSHADPRETFVYVSMSEVSRTETRENGRWLCAVDGGGMQRLGCPPGSHDENEEMQVTRKNACVSR